MVRAEAIRQTKLAFDDLVKQINAAQDTPGVGEALETKHGFNRFALFLNSEVDQGLAIEKSPESGRIRAHLAVKKNKSFFGQNNMISL